MKRSVLLILAIVLALTAVGVCRAGAGENRGLTMLVVPTRYSVMQVAFDMVNRHGAVLVSYEGDASSVDPRLFVWDGREWLYITLQDYTEATFLEYRPDRTVLVGGDRLLPPVLVEDVSLWCPDVLTIPSIETADLINSFGSIYAFSGSEWNWFARRYNLNLKNLNTKESRGSWYDRSSYEDRWSDRWSWLRPKQAEPKPAPVDDDGMSAIDYEYLDEVDASVSVEEVAEPVPAVAVEEEVIEVDAVMEEAADIPSGEFLEPMPEDTFEEPPVFEEDVMVDDLADEVSEEADDVAMPEAEVVEESVVVSPSIPEPAPIVAPRPIPPQREIEINALDEYQVK